MRSRGLWTLLLLGLVAAGPADDVPTPKPKRCLAFLGDVAEGETETYIGLSYVEVRTALNAVIQHALKCKRPADMEEVHLTFEMIVGCDGLVKTIETTDAGGAPATYAACVSAVIEKADFPAHDNENGFPITYPVDVTW